MKRLHDKFALVNVAANGIDAETPRQRGITAQIETTSCRLVITSLNRGD